MDAHAKIRTRVAQILIPNQNSSFLHVTIISTSKLLPQFPFRQSQINYRRVYDTWIQKRVWKFRYSSVALWTLLSWNHRKWSPQKKVTTISVYLMGTQWASETLEGNGLLRCFDEVQLRYTHLLQAKREEIARGRTSWKRKHSTSPISAQSCVWFKWYSKLFLLKNSSINRRLILGWTGIRLGVDLLEHPSFFSYFRLYIRRNKIKKLK